MVRFIIAAVTAIGRLVAFILRRKGAKNVDGFERVLSLLEEMLGILEVHKDPEIRAAAANVRKEVSEASYEK